jgi:hypothetical protein
MNREYATFVKSSSVRSVTSKNTREIAINTKLSFLKTIYILDNAAIARSLLKEPKDVTTWHAGVSTSSVMFVAKSGLDMTTFVIKILPTIILSMNSNVVDVIVALVIKPVEIIVNRFF